MIKLKRHLNNNIIIFFLGSRADYICGRGWNHIVLGIEFRRCIFAVNRSIVYDCSGVPRDRFGVRSKDNTQAEIIKEKRKNLKIQNQTE